ncbi:MAG: M48 family metalloprotease [Terriglobales bacterium]
MSSLYRHAALVAVVLLLAPAVCAQSGRQEYSEKDKKKMAEIAQRPEVMEFIERAWQAKQKEDMEFAFNANTSTRLGQLLGPQYAEYRTKYGQLYDNPILLRYVNSLGQKLVPSDSPNVYSFKLLLNPTPDAFALSTGTVYITTGLVSVLDNEAQLSYILAHELAHVERKHHYNNLRNAILEEELIKEKEAEGQKKKAIWGLIGAAAGGIAGGVAGGGSWAGIGALAGGVAGAGIAHLVYRNRLESTDWDAVHENEADEAAMKYMLQQNYDAREVPRLYARLTNLVGRDRRVGLGFIAGSERIRQRSANIQNLLSGAYQAEIASRAKGGLTGSGPDFALLMSALKRDNGIIAMDYDLLAMARDNLEEAAQLRSNDPRVHYHLGRVIAMSGRTAEDRQAAVQAFLKGIQYDVDRGAYPELHLEHALHLISQNNPAMQAEVQNELKAYVALYQRERAGQLPPNMHIIYDYFLLAGDASWYVPPVSVISTKNVDAVYVKPVESAPSTATAEVVGRATGKASEESVPWQMNTSGDKQDGKVVPATRKQPVPPR